MRRLERSYPKEEEGSAADAGHIGVSFFFSYGCVIYYAGRRCDDGTEYRCCCSNVAEWGPLIGSGRATTRGLEHRLREGMDVIGDGDEQTLQAILGELPLPPSPPPSCFAFSVFRPLGHLYIAYIAETCCFFF